MPTVAASPPDLATGDLVVLRTAPGRLARARGLVGRIVRFEAAARIQVVDVRFDDGTGEGHLEPDIPLAYLEKAPPDRAKRRGVLNLHAPKDTRKEAEKQAEAKAWLEARDYLVTEIGQFRSAAVCWKCTRERAATTGDSRPVKVFCPVHRSPVFSPDTGSDPGATDWEVTRPDWPYLMLIGMEWKRDGKAHRRPEQIERERLGRSVFVWSLAMCLQAVHAFECADPRIEPHPEIREWLESHGLLMEVSPA